MRWPLALASLDTPIIQAWMEIGMKKAFASTACSWNLSVSSERFLSCLLACLLPPFVQLYIFTLPLLVYLPDQLQTSTATPSRRAMNGIIRHTKPGFGTPYHLLSRSLSVSPHDLLLPAHCLLARCTSLNNLLLVPSVYLTTYNPIEPAEPTRKGNISPTSRCIENPIH